MSRRIAFLVVLAVLAATGVAACGSDGTSDPADGNGDGRVVTIKTFDFQPDPITIDAGDRVTFVNHDAIDHTVTAGTRDNPTPAAFDGRLPAKGSRFELTIDEPGTYRYFCTIHPGPGMTGVIEAR